MNVVAARAEDVERGEAWRDSPEAPRVPLGELVHIVAGQSPPGSTYRSAPVGLPFFQGKADFGDRHPIARVWCTEPNKIAQPGDVLMSIRAPVGPTNVADTECCIGRGLAALRCGPTLDRDYLLWFLRCIESDIAKQGSGSTFHAINRDQLEALEIPLPPLAEQERIAGRLTEQLAAVERARAAAANRLAAAEALPASLLREVFEGPETSGWETQTLGDLLRRFNEIIHPGDRKSGEAVFVGLEHIEPHTGRRIGSGKIDFASMTGRKPTFKRGHIVYGYLRPYLNKVWVADFDGCSSVDQFAFTVHPDLADTIFVATFMRSATFLRRAQGVTTTGQLPRISIDEIAAVKIDLPPDLATQRRVAGDLSARLAAAEGVIAQCRQELAGIEALPAALLRAAFHGAS